MKQDDSSRIPQVIHYCWFGQSKKSGLIQECIESWKKNLPNYEIIEWNEQNFNIDCCEYVREAYQNKKWAFVSDYARLWVLYEYGGLYFDTDVQVLKSFDQFLEEELFTGFEAKDSPVTAVMGAKKGDKLVKQMLDYYEDKHFVNPDGTLNQTTNTIIITQLFIEKGIKRNGKKQSVDGLTVYPQIYFCPNNFSRIWNRPSKDSFAVHHFDQSWKAESANHSTLTGRIKRYVVGVARNTLGTNTVARIASIIK